MKGPYDCPQCGGAVPFESSIAVFAVCPFCRSMVVRNDVNVEAIGQMAVLPPDLSPLQLGSRGVFDGQGFRLIGRVRLTYVEGSWTEWFTLFDDGRHGWVAETQGFFTVSFTAEVDREWPEEGGSWIIGTKVAIDGVAYTVTDLKKTVCQGGEGELPFPAKPQREATSLDLTGPGGRFANLELADDGRRFFVGRYTRFDDLAWTNLRPVPGWSEGVIEPVRDQTTAMNCPRCGATVTLRAAGFAMSAVCESCASLIDTATPELRRIGEAHGRQKFQPLIPLGRRGLIQGVTYEVIGFQHVRDEYSGWTEYLLFNPWQGFSWLVTYQGHWSLVRRIFEPVEISEGWLVGSSRTVRFRGESYRLFAEGEVRTDYVAGEFYWKVCMGLKVNTTDLVHPPRILSREVYSDSAEETWSQGEYVEPAAIDAAFDLKGVLRESEGIYLNQPNPFAERYARLGWTVWIVAALLVLIQWASVKRAARQNVFHGDYSYQSAVTNHEVVTPSFLIEGGRQAVSFVFSAPVDNRWVELDIDLIDDATQQAIESFEQGIEFYHGYDDGEWSEGSTVSRRLVPGVAGGNYHLIIDASADPALTQIPFTVDVIRDVPVWSNFWIALGLVLVYPLYCGVRSNLFERARWTDSDYSPYISVNSDDDDE